MSSSPDAARQQRNAFRTSGDSGFYDKGPSTATFLVEVDGQAVGRFTKVDGLEVEVTTEELEEGGQNGFVHKLPGRMSWPNITLSRGVTETDNLLTWLNKSSGEGFTAGVDGTGNKLKRSTMAIVLISANGTRLRAWNVEGAFPVRWRGPSFATEADDLPEEELEIAHHGFKSAAP